MVIAKNNLVTQKLNSLSDYFYTLTSYLGFTVDDILVYGRNKTAIEEINNIVNTRRGDNILRLDIRQMKSDLEQLPWVKSATVSRSYLPNLLKITLKERRVRSLWQINNAFTGRHRRRRHPCRFCPFPSGAADRRPRRAGASERTADRG